MAYSKMINIDPHKEIEDIWPQLVEHFTLDPKWLFEKVKFFLPDTDLSTINEIKDKREKVSELLVLLRTMNVHVWKEFFQSVCMECSLPMDLEIRLMSISGDGASITLGSEAPSVQNPSAQMSVCCSRIPCGASSVLCSLLLFSDLNQKQELDDKTVTSQSTEFEQHHPPPTSNSAATGKEAKRQRLDSGERYRCQMINSALHKYESKREQGQLKQLTFNQVFVNLQIKQTKTSKSKEKVEKSKDEAGSSEAEECADTVMEIPNLFENAAVSNTRVIFMVGKPGTGKTMLMHRICHVWAHGSLPQFQFAFLFEFRQLNLINRKVTVKELFFDLFLQPEVSPDEAFHYILENAHRVLVIFDGLDEFVGSLSASSSRTPSDLHKPLSIAEIFASLYHGRLLSGCTVMVTCRPKKLPDHTFTTVDMVAEVLGFDQDKVKEYASHFFLKSSLKEQAIAHLKNNAKLMRMCFVPALCYIVCICLEYMLSKGLPCVELPDTITQFYVKMLMIFISRQQNLSSVQSEEMQLNKYRLAIFDLCDLARKGLKEKKIVFYVGDISEQVKEFASMHGLMSVFDVKKLGSSQETGYAFVHLSLQEFFATLYLMINKSVSSASLKSNLSLKSKWTFRSKTKTWFTDSFHIFLSGLSSKECRVFLTHLAEQSEAWVTNKQAAVLQSLKKLAAMDLTGPKIIELCHCTYETQDLELALQVGSNLKFKYEFRNFRITPVDIMALVFVINHGRSLIRLDFAGCLMETDCLEVLAKCENLDQLSFRNRKYGDKFAEALSKSLPKIGTLKKLELTGGNITAVGLAELARALPLCQQIEEINLQDNRLKDDDMIVIFKVFSKKDTLRKMDLSNNDVTVSGLLALAKAAATCPRITEVNMRGDIPRVIFYCQSERVLEIPSALDLKSSEIKTEKTGRVKNMKLRLQECKLGPQELKDIATILRACSSLSDLDFSGNQLGDEGCATLVELLPELHISNQLNLSKNQLSPEGACCLSNVINTCLTVKEVHISLENQRAIIMFHSDEDEDVSSLHERYNAGKHFEFISTDIFKVRLDKYLVEIIEAGGDMN
ncbi:protein NLRC5-like [Rhinatrema bivittatum]|uniref:protein NLRC5-like n=1 Tax=Rhinatrema bivittatum TaxID=194408 RepID=UPI00112CEB4E|nr:protein NLRC5-like [Rhinatrema bivittatum]